MKTPQAGEEYAKRPVLDNLYNMRYKYDPEKYKNANYEAFLDKQIRNRNVKHDPLEIKMDEFAESIRLVKDEASHIDFGDKDFAILRSDEIDRIKEQEEHDLHMERARKKEKFDLMARYQYTFSKAALAD